MQPGEVKVNVEEGSPSWNREILEDLFDFVVELKQLEKKKEGCREVTRQLSATGLICSANPPSFTFAHSYTRFLTQ